MEKIECSDVRGIHGRRNKNLRFADDIDLLNDTRGSFAKAI